MRRSPKKPSTALSGTKVVQGVPGMGFKNFSDCLLGLPKLICVDDVDSAGVIN